MMMRLAIPLGLLLLAGPVFAGPVDPRTEPAPPPGGAHVDRHVDAHVPAREGEPAVSAADSRSDTRPSDVAPDPAPGTGVFQSSPRRPGIQDRRDPLYRDRRF